MYYIVNAGGGYEGVPNLDPTTGQLTLPRGETLAEGAGWITITIKPALRERECSGGRRISV